MALPRTVKIVEVSPRDGLQNEPELVPTGAKIELINMLSASGLKVIEAGSFVSPKLLPQLADTAKVLAGIEQYPDVLYPVLVPNKKGFDRALAAQATSIAVFTTPSETFSIKNTNATIKESMTRTAEVIKLAKSHGFFVRAYLSCVLGCPYEGKISPRKVADLVKVLSELGADEISLGDTIGIGTPKSTSQLLEVVLSTMSVENVAVHFHDTYGMALANIYAALLMGVQTIDASVGGLGGCPYAKGATGNVATEDVVYMLSRMDIDTHVNLDKLIDAAQFITQILGRPSQARITQIKSL